MQNYYFSVKHRSSFPKILPQIIGIALRIMPKYRKK